MIRSPAIYTNRIKGPTAKEMAAKWPGLGISLAAAKAVKNAMNGGDVQAALEIASQAMGGFGWSEEEPSLWYVDMGGITETTLCFDGKKFYIGATIDYLEEQDRKRERRRRR